MYHIWADRNRVVTVKKLRNMKAYLSLPGSIGVFLAVFLWFISDTQGPKTLAETPAKLVQVSIVEAAPSAQPIYIEANGITLSRWPTAVSATVSGRVIALMEDMHPGRLVDTGNLLVSLQDTGYRAEVAAARARVAEARLRLEQVKSEQFVVNQAGTAKSSFGRFEPHVKAAQAQLRASTAELAAAQQQLADTQITAAFPAVIISEQVSPGQWINAGEQLFTLASSESLEIRVELSAADWRRLGALSEHQSADVYDPSGIRWQARLRYLSPVMDPVTRQRSVVLEVLNPYRGDAPLLPDQQVKVRFTGANIEQVVRAPASALTEDGRVWSVNAGKLHLEDIELLDEQAEFILFRYRHQPSRARSLVRYPLSSMLNGQDVAVLNTPRERT